MCGFFGVFRPRGGPALDRGWLERRLAAVGHRGPDARGAYVRGASGLAAGRLAIQGDHRGDPPLASANGRILLAFNGEILDRDGPARLVRAAGGELPEAGAGDGPLLAEAIAALARLPGGIQGPHLLALLEGAMAALAAWDLETGELWLARDRLGVKPLFVVEAEDAFLFASEIRPLLEAVPGARVPDPAGLVELLHRQRPVSSLPFRGVDFLRPGAAWRVAASGRVTRWTGGQGIRDLVDRTTLEGMEAAAALRDALAASAGRACETASSPALFLSGGLDSGAVAALAAPCRPRAWTGRFAPPGGPMDESAAAATVAAAASLRHQIVDLEDADLLDDLSSVVTALGVPMAGPGALSLWRLARCARETTKVVLTGTGGDELLGGYVRTALVLGREGPWTRGYEPLAARIDAAGSDFEARRLAAADRAGDLEALLSPEFLGALPAFVPRASRGEGLDALVADEVEETLPMLLDVEDRVLMANGLEGRPVFCLGGVPAAAARVPLDALVGPDGEGKRVLREALVGLLPEAVLRDPRKRGFPTPFARAARGAGRARAMAVIADRRFRERGWWRPERCLAALDADRPVHDRALYAVLSWELWARAYLDGDALRAEDPVR